MQITTPKKFSMKKKIQRKQNKKARSKEKIEPGNNVPRKKKVPSDWKRRPLCVSKTAKIPTSSNASTPSVRTKPIREKKKKKKRKKRH